MKIYYDRENRRLVYIGESATSDFWDLSIFRNQNWKKWWNCVNESGGIYKYRWGDLEIHSLYMRMYYPDSAWYNFDFYEKGKCKHAGYGMVHQRPKIIQKIIQVMSRSLLTL